MGNEFVMVPLDLVDRILHRVEFSREDFHALIRLRDNREKHQGEPVAWIHIPDEYNKIPFVTWRSPDEQRFYNASVGAFSTTRMCLTPLYTHAGPVEVERYKGELQSLRVDAASLAGTVEGLRAKLAEREALLRDLVSMNVPRTMAAIEKAKALISASAEPSAPKCKNKLPCLRPQLCGTCKPSAPVERDEISDKQRLDSIEELGFSISATKFVGGFCGPKGRQWLVFKYGCGFEVYGETLREALDAARAALERKP